jgi:hypothetical protein
MKSMFSLLFLFLQRLFMLLAPCFADPLFSEIPASTLNEIKDGIVFDNFFVDTPLQRYFRAEGSLDPFYGGAAMQVPFQFARLAGGAIAPGQDVAVTRRQILDAALFVPKLYTAFVALEEFQLKVLNAGPEAKVDLYELYIETLTKGLNTDVEIDWYLHGQANATTIASNRSLNMNGLAEALNDGVTNSWNGDIFTTYGAQLRNGQVGNALNSIPQWLGDSNGAPGTISYEVMLQTYLLAIERPTMGLTSRQGYTYIAAMLQRQQRYQVDVDTNIEMRGIRFEEAIIFNDLLTPSAVSPALLPTGLSQTTTSTPGSGGVATFTSAASPATASKLPGSKAITVGELLLWLHIPSWRYRPAADPDFLFGVRGPIPSPTNPTLDTLFMNLSLNSYTPVPRNSIQCYGLGA